MCHKIVQMHLNYNFIKMGKKSEKLQDLHGQKKPQTKKPTLPRKKQNMKLYM